MIQDLDEALKQLLIQKGGLDPSAMDIRFDLPPRQEATGLARPTVSLYLYDVHENVELREMAWDTEREGNHKVRIKRRPLRVDLSYLITCWTQGPEDQHRLLWRVLETLTRNTPIPADLMRGNLQQTLHPIEMRVAQPGGGPSAAEVWNSLQAAIPPAIHLVATVDLDLEQVRTEPLVFARTLQVIDMDHSAATELGKEAAAKLPPRWEAAPLAVGGLVHRVTGEPVVGAAVRLISPQVGGPPLQVGPSVLTDAQGHYKFLRVLPGEYTLVVEVHGQVVQQQFICISVGERGEPLPMLMHDVEVPENDR